MDANDNAGYLNDRVVQRFSRASSLLQRGMCCFFTGKKKSLKSSLMGRK